MTAPEFAFTCKDANTAPALSAEERSRRIAEEIRAEKLRPAVLLALAYVHVVGWMPRGIHSRTYCDVVCYHAERAEPKNTQYGPMLKDGKLYHVRPEHLEEVEGHPLVQAVRYLEGRGFKVRNHQYGGGGTRSVEMFGWNEEKDRSLTAHAYRHGYWSIEYGRERGQV